MRESNEDKEYNRAQHRAKEDQNASPDKLHEADCNLYKQTPPPLTHTPHTLMTKRNKSRKRKRLFLQFNLARESQERIPSCTLIVFLVGLLGYLIHSFGNALASGSFEFKFFWFIWINLIWMHSPRDPLSFAPVAASPDLCTSCSSRPWRISVTWRAHRRQKRRARRQSSTGVARGPVSPWPSVGTCKRMEQEPTKQSRQHTTRNTEHGACHIPYAICHMPDATAKKSSMDERLKSAQIGHPRRMHPARLLSYTR